MKFYSYAPYTIWNSSTARIYHGKVKTFYDTKELYVQFKSLSRKQNKLRHFESQKKYISMLRFRPIL